MIKTANVSRRMTWTGLTSVFALSSLLLPVAPGFAQVEKPGAGPAGTAHDFLEPLRLVTLSLGQPHRQHGAPAITDHVRLGAEAALGAAQRMAFGFLALR